MRQWFLGLVLCFGFIAPALAQEKEKTERKYEHRKFDSSLFTENAAATRSDYLEALQKLYQLLSQAPPTIESFGQLGIIQARLGQEDSALALLKDRMSQNERTFNIRNLQMFNTLLDELNNSDGRYARTLDLYDRKLDTVKKQIAGLRKDTLVLHIFRDTALLSSFRPQLLVLRDKWREVDSFIKTNSTIVNNLQARSSANSILIGQLISQVDNQLKTVGTHAFGKERRYLWEPRSITGPSVRGGFQQSIDSEQQLLRYYFSNTRSKRFWLLLTGLLFYYWVWFNYRSLRRKSALAALDDFHFTWLRPWPFAATGVFLLTLAPLFDIHAPAIYIESTQFLLMLVLTILFFHKLPRHLFQAWLFFLILFVSVPVTRILGLPTHMERWANLIQDILSVALGVYLLFSRKKWLDLHPEKKFTGVGRFIASAAALYLFFNLLAIIGNLTGRVTLSQIFGDTAVYALAQTISLTVFVYLVVEAFLLQIQGSRVRKEYPGKFESTSIIRSVTRGASILAGLLWLIVFTTNLDLFDVINDDLTDLFNTPRQVGSIPFTIGGITLFLGIIWLANFLQRYIAYFFGDVGDDATIVDKGQRSRLMVTRLILLVLGFLLAVAASGLPVDRITVILGALSVGIGLGLQSIVNNFISGVILIFDRPLRIGDIVEIGDKKGRVKEIGIRSSTLLTDEGAEVIIPNGDVLSHNIVNWTLSNNFVRVSLAFTIERPADGKTIQPEVIRDLVKANPNVLERREPEVHISKASSKTLSIQVYFWCTDFNRTAITSGEISSGIYEWFEKTGITVL